MNDIGRNIKICHLTTVHRRYDARIFFKECRSLVRAGFTVELIVADGKGNELKENITISDVGQYRNRIVRFLFSYWRMIKKAKKTNSDIYHFHDPELIFTGLFLKMVSNKKVIYDVHEDYPRQILYKDYLIKPIQKIVSLVFEIIENFASNKFDLIVTATPYIERRFSKVNSKVVTINNFPYENEFQPVDDWNVKKNEICYVGGLEKFRGIIELVKAMENTSAVLNLGGKFSPSSLKEEVETFDGWEKVNFIGYLDRSQMKEVFYRSKIGVVNTHPVANHMVGQPVKLFEYMAAGIPVIASNFPLWKDIIEKAKCGITIDPQKPMEISEAINFLLLDSVLAEKYGRNGRRAIEQKYKWENEEIKLIDAYRNLLGKSSNRTRQ